MPPRRIPLWLKLAYTAWLVVWVPSYWDYYGPYNFLWFCDIANFLFAAAIWIESPLLFSWSAVSVLVVQVLWIIDFFGRLLLGFHPIGGTEYMFQSRIPIFIRGLSFFHLAMPPLLLWGVRKLGYDRRAFGCQTAFSCVILPLSWLVTPKEKNINWVWGPFDEEQKVLPPCMYLAVTIVSYPILLYLPAHLFLRWWSHRGSVDPRDAPR